jgi:hypothetical protein
VRVQSNIPRFQIAEINSTAYKSSVTDNVKPEVKKFITENKHFQQKKIHHSGKKNIK